MNTRNTILNALLSLAVAIEFVFDLGCRFGQWFRDGGREQIIHAIALAITAIVWTCETVAIGAKVMYRNRHAIMDAAGRPFVYSV